MEGERSERDLLTAFLLEVGHLPGVEVQVNRRRQDDPKKWEYLGRLELEYEDELHFLKAKEAVGLYELIPFPEIQRRWGGGRYQFRFFWQDEEGRKTRKGSSNGVLHGDPIPRP